MGEMAQSHAAWHDVSMMASNLQLTQYSTGKNKENTENLLGKLASNQKQSDYKAGFHSEGR
jgi:hypothetical protein